ncbi:hypothetical protein BDV26DRAFT_253828 [Aspergillus bertholletiae]|uniref:Uncharacterized protein n=1 Tax=Aspergillus bertholletiae TaxID=1226010 RepID=A0A5N7BLH0_9EURO|nr:hypothetical protein BDV26DRAFT_253828 [Aspergillus bertholletiae]
MSLSESAVSCLFHLGFVTFHAPIRSNVRGLPLDMNHDPYWQGSYSATVSLQDKLCFLEGRGFAPLSLSHF